MPREIQDPEEFLALAEKASECRIKRHGDITKIKLRTSRQLYTLKIETAKADEILEKIRCPKKEF
jgi:ferritin-like protein